MKHRCRDVSHLVLKSQDQPLRWGERFAIKSHLIFCDACRRFESQMKFVKQGLSVWRGDDSVNPPDKRSSSDIE